MQEAKDLTKEAPRSPHVKIAGFVTAARMLDKCRATINATNGEYKFDCPMDNTLFSFVGVNGDKVKEKVSAGASDEEIGAWLQEKSGKSDEEIATWSATEEAISYFTHSDSGKKEWFIGECQKLGLNPEETTLFDYLDVDDSKSFS